MKYLAQSTEESPPEERLLKAKDIASILNISLGYAYMLMKQGELPTIHLGGAVRVRRADLEEYIRMNTSS